MNLEYELIDNSLNQNELLKNESLFHLANGYIGVRGNFEEGYANSFSTIRGTYLNGFYDIGDLKYTEKFTGFPTEYQKLINVIDVQDIEIFIDEEKFSLFDGKILNFERKLDMKKGTVTRNMHWQSNKGHEIKICITRMISFNVLELFLINYEIESVNFDGNIKVISKQNADVQNFSDANDPRLAHESVRNIIFEESIIDEDSTYIIANTSRSNLKIVSGVKHTVPENIILQYEKNNAALITSFEFKIKVSECISFSKYCVFTDSIRYKNTFEKAKEILHTVAMLGTDYWISQQELYLSNFWKKSDIKISGEEKFNVSIRFSLFSLLQSVGKDIYSNIAAKGLSGEGYEGHYFWDTEIYLFPFFLLTDINIAYNLLSFRYRILDKARDNAKLLGHKQGALFPWRTITGTECSSYFPSGSAQYHINGDIAYTFIQYYLVTKDIEMIKNIGAEVLFEVARLWMDAGHFYKDSFRIDCVTGPDEYTCLVNNNYYTNTMAKYSLEWAVKFYNILKENDLLNSVLEKINLLEDEVVVWQKAADKMFLNVDKELNINPQDDSFLQKKLWDFENTPKENYPLLLHYHPMYIYRHQVLKQADTVLAHFLVEDYQKIDIIKNSFEYYEKITTHDSSLSTCIYGIMASRLSLKEKAYDYFLQTVTLDFDDTHNNTKYGLHIANMGGTFLTIIYGFAGMRIKEDGIYFRPQLPDSWKELSFSFAYLGQDVKCVLNKNKIKFEKNSSEVIIIFINDKKYDLENILEVDMI